MTTSTTGKAKDIFQILGVKRSSSPKELRHAYRIKSKELHPDRNSSTTATQDFIDLQKSFQVEHSICVARNVVQMCLDARRLCRCALRHPSGMGISGITALFDFRAVHQAWMHESMEMKLGERSPQGRDYEARRRQEMKDMFNESYDNDFW